MSKLNLVSKTINIMVNIMVQTIGCVKITHLNELCKLTHFCVFSNTSLFHAVIAKISSHLAASACI